MFKRIATLGIALLLIGSLSSCIFDPKPATVVEKPPIEWPDLTEKNHVLITLRDAYNQQDIDHYTAILDPVDFVYFFSPGDVGGDIPESWGFSSDVKSAQTMFNKGGGKDNNPILSIDLTLDIESASWVEFNPVDYPGWFETTIGYTFKIDTENETTYITSGSPRAQFRIRQDEGGKWRLVQWNDIAGQ
jgi:hypothetical protein